METKGKNPKQQEVDNVPKTGNSTQTDSKDDMEQLLEKTQSFGVDTPLMAAENKSTNGNAKCKGAFAIAAAQDNWELLEIKRIVAEAQRDFYS
ncbi:hypothetical protein LY78DRAFT_585911 [Colletotrichum sublineola]|uniref:Uncharacterized protein n=1 Tax=Colletotrichum sublineola TaxID=1173701 RepID=A0A066WWK8_COLSU|nr:hypothetical protein LY78DRAFT_585911 [Colletotrichum sublineola]KDN61263.1 hypothetical protein CSUB01_07027 [Colletotrichum sublineola]